MLKHGQANTECPYCQAPLPRAPAFTPMNALRALGTFLFTITIALPVHIFLMSPEEMPLLNPEYRCTRCRRLFRRFAPRGAETGAVCRACGYDLTGNTTGRCPECGTPTAPARPPTRPRPPGDQP